MHDLLAGTSPDRMPVLVDVTRQPFDGQSSYAKAGGAGATKPARGGRFRALPICLVATPFAPPGTPMYDR